VNVLDRNVAVDNGELDLIIVVRKLRVAVEVKSASGDVDPIVHFDADKRSQVRQLARKTSCRRIDLVLVWYRADGVWIRWLRGV
jgi:Holliday junction resolvase-like predicted endonuclease